MEVGADRPYAPLRGAATDIDPAAAATSLRRLRALLVVALLAIAGLAVALAVAVSGRSASHVPSVTPGDHDRVSFFHVTDLHLDPFYDADMSCTHFCRTTQLYLSGTVCGPKVRQPAPFAAPFGRYGCDSPQALVDSAVAAMKAVDDAPAFILVSGDLAAHQLCGNATILGPCVDVLEPNAEALRAIRLAVDTLRAQFPSTPIIGLFGNNDVPHHYVTPLGSLGETWLADVRAIWEPAATCADCADASARLPPDASDFSVWESTGSYSVRIGSDPAIRVVALNTLLCGVLEDYNLTYAGGLRLQKEAAEQMMSWLDATLAAAAAQRERVVLSSHMPPGMQPYNDKRVWDAPYVQQYVDTVGKHIGAVAGQLYGHFHYDTFRVLTRGEGAGDGGGQRDSGPGGAGGLHDFGVSQAGPGPGVTDPIGGSVTTGGAGAAGDAGVVLIAPSISPVNRNNPAFRRMLLNRTSGLVDDYEQHWCDLAASNADANAANSGGSGVSSGNVGRSVAGAAGASWALQYKFSDLYGRDTSPAAMANLAQQLLVDTRLYSEYLRHRQVLYSPFRHHFTCAMLRLNETAYDACRADAARLDFHDSCQPAS